MSYDPKGRSDVTQAELEKLPYRPCVGIMLLNRENRVFVAQRLDMKTEAWQMPQGGIDEGEEPRTAAFRELEEEIGTSRAEILAESAGWLHYDLPAELVGKLWKGRYRGQTQKWFAMRFLGEDAEIDIETETPEFSEWKWAMPERLPELIVPFKRALYRRVLDEFRPLLAGAERG
jgi:putative (di)nucleoside polyphosphate hydrolase